MLRVLATIVRTLSVLLLSYNPMFLSVDAWKFAFSGAGAGSPGYNGVYSMQHAAALAAQQCLVSTLKDDPKAGHAWVNLAAAYAASGCVLDANQCLEQVGLHNVEVSPETVGCCLCALELWSLLILSFFSGIEVGALAHVNKICSCCSAGA